MAVHWTPSANVQRTAHGYSALPEDIIVIPELSGRMDATDVTDLARDIEANGQLELAVCWKNDSGFPVLAAGHRRYRAVVEINKRRTENQEHLRLQFSFIPAQTEEQAFDYTVRENRNRINPSPLDEGFNASIYQTKWGLSLEAIARKYYPGISTDEEIEKAVKEIKTTLELLNLSDEAKEELRKGFFSTTAAQQLAAIPSRAKQNEIIKAARDKGAKKLKVDDVKAASGKPISENSPSAQLKKYKKVAELAAGLAAEMLAESPEPEVFMDLSRNIIVKIKDLDFSMLPPGYDQKAESYRPKIEAGEVMAAA